MAALFANAVPYLLFAVAEQRVDSSTAGVINATTPLWTVILALMVGGLIQGREDRQADARRSRTYGRGRIYAESRCPRTPMPST